MFTRLQLRRTFSATLAMTALLGLCQASLAADVAPESVLKGSRRASDMSLPPRALRSSGVVGTLNTAALDASSVSLTLPDGRVVTAVRQRVAENKSKTTKSWVGEFPVQPGSLLVMTMSKGVTTGFASLGAETWELMPVRGGGSVIYRVDDSRLPTQEPVLIPPKSTTANDSFVASDFGNGTSSTTATTGGYVHDLLVVYSPASVAQYGQPALESMIQSAVQAANQAYQNSNIGITLNLVGMRQVSYIESGSIQASLYALQDVSDGAMDEVHQLRDSVGADLVALVSEDIDACGIGWVMSSVSEAFATYAFSVVSSSCLSNHSLAHEIGHNQGNMHDRASSSSAGAYPYSYGFRRCATDGTGFRTVMSYSCTGANRVTQFSNPNVLYNGYATGVSYELDPQSSAENSRSMNNTAGTVAAFRGASSGGGTPTAPAAPSNLAATSTSSSSVTLQWTDNAADETGFKLERSTDGSTFTEIATLGIDSNSFVDSDLAALTVHYYRVRSYNSTGNSAYSNTSSAKTIDLPPVAPQYPAATNNGDGSATFSWADASANESGFEVRRETWDAKRRAWKGALVVGTTTAGITSLVDMCGSGTYRYAVRAVNSAGGSAYAGPVSVTVTSAAATKSRGKP